MRHFTATLAANELLAPKTFVLHLTGAAPLVEALPGQFVMLRGEWGRDPLLPRAFSILAVRPDGGAELLVKTAGRATALLEAARPGARLELLGPLGTSFPAPSPARSDWLVAGGVGLAPLLFHAERAARAGLAEQVHMFYGGRSAKDLVLLERLEAYGVALHLATEDGSRGTRGRVTTALEAALGAAPEPPTLMACGPEPMLVAVAEVGRAHRLKSYLSLEGEMACGIGVCLGCAVACESKPYRYTCKDGPVMDLDDLKGPYT